MNAPQARLLRANSPEALAEMHADLTAARANRDDVKAQLRRQIKTKIKNHQDRELFELFLVLGT